MKTIVIDTPIRILDYNLRTSHSLETKNLPYSCTLATISWVAWQSFLELNPLACMPSTTSTTATCFSAGKYLLVGETVVAVRGDK